MESIWQTTCTTLKSAVEPDWQDAYDYQRPLSLLLTRYGWLSAADREDLVAELLLDIKSWLFKRYLPGRGKFRSFLCGVVRHRVQHVYRRRKKQVPLEKLGEPGEVPPEQATAIDLVAEVLSATRRWCTARRLQAELDVELLHQRLLGNRSYAEIIPTTGHSLIGAKRVVGGARRAIVAALLERTMPGAADSGRGLDWVRLAGFALAALGHPRRQAEILTGVADPRLREGLADWLALYRQALQNLPGQETSAGVDLQKGLEVIFFESTSAEDDTQPPVASPSQPG